ncbi:MAG TPA: hypothetical protein VI542_14985 [Candidatus Tectomicrobia bacterium]
MMIGMRFSLCYVWMRGMTKGYANLGLLNLDAEHLDAAEALFTKALSTDSTSHACSKQLGSLSVKQGQFAAVPAIFEHVLTLQPTYNKASYNLGK